MGLLLFKTCEVYGECLNFKRNPKGNSAIKYYNLPNLTGLLAESLCKQTWEVYEAYSSSNIFSNSNYCSNCYSLIKPHRFLAESSINL
jgi:hypothetical protein